MDTLIEQAIQQKHIPGMAYAIISDDTISTRILGLSEYPDVPLKEGMLYDIASLTKLFTTTRILQLMESHKLSLSDPIKNHLPRFANPDITIELCLNHRSGLAPSHSGRYTISRNEMIESILRCDDLINPINTLTNYSCINFLILGLVIEALDGPLDESIAQNITRPLHMTHTGFNPTSPDQCVPTEIMASRGLIRGEVHDETARAMGGVAGNAGIFSTLSDLTRFVSAVMNAEIINAETLNLIHHYNVNKRSLGWNTFGKEILYHTGFTGPAITIDLDSKRALILLTNRVHPSREDTGYLAQRDAIITAFLEKK